MVFSMCGCLYSIMGKTERQSKRGEQEEMWAKLGPDQTMQIKAGLTSLILISLRTFLRFHTTSASKNSKWEAPHKIIEGLCECSFHSWLNMCQMRWLWCTNISETAERTRTSWCLKVICFRTSNLVLAAGNINWDQTAVKTLTASMRSTSDTIAASNALFIADIPVAVIHVKTEQGSRRTNVRDNLPADEGWLGSVRQTSLTEDAPIQQSQNFHPKLTKSKTNHPNPLVLLCC